MDALIKTLAKSGLLREDLDYHLIRASMVIIFLFFGYQKWFDYEAQVLIPYISNGPLIFWMYPVFGIRGASWFLGVSEWLFGALLFLGFWNKKLGILGALGSCVTFVMTVTIIPFMPNGWAASATSGPIPSHLHGVADERIAHHHHLAGLQFDIVDLKVRADDGGPDLTVQKDESCRLWTGLFPCSTSLSCAGHAGSPKCVTLRPYGAGTGLEARDRATISLADRNPSAA